MTMYFVALSLLTAASFVSLTQGQVCPEGCVCFKHTTTVRCMFSNLRTIPTMPDDTTVLDLRHNKITDIPPGAFSNLRQLRTLLLNNNEFRIIRNGAFRGLNQLRTLYLYKNRINSIEAQAFNGLGDLRQLFLHKNNISTLPDGLFEHTNNLRRIRLDANPLVCNCDLIWLTEYLSSKTAITQSSVICAKPPSAQGLNVATLNTAQFRCSPPSFTQHPTHAEAESGSTVYFTCRAAGSPSPDITWLHRGAEVDLNDDRIEVLDDGTLIIRQVQIRDSGIYECVAQNEGGVIRSQRARLVFVSDRNTLRFLRRPQNRTTIEGETVRMACETEGQPTPVSRWTRNGNRIRSNPRLRVTESGTLYIASVRYADRGLYKCTATNNERTISAVARLTVHTPPTIRGSPGQLRTRIGRPIDLTCVVNGYPQPAVTWIKDQETLSSGGAYEIKEDGKVLKIPSPVEADRGRYTCRARNAVGTELYTILLEIDSSTAPTFSRPQPDKHVTPGSVIRLDCLATADPAPSYRWLRDGVEMSSQGRFNVDRNHVIVLDAQKSDQGVYECVAQNAAGSARSSIAVWVQDASRYPGDNFVRSAFNQASQNVDRAINRTRSELFDRTRTHTVEDLLRLVRYPSRNVVQIARAAEVFEETLEIVQEHVRAGNQYKTDGGNSTFADLVSPALLNMLANMSGCLPHQRVIDCSDMCFYRKYRAIDGICNNLAHPTWGAASAEFRRLLPAQYENGFNTPRGWDSSKRYNGHRLPSARLVSTSLLSSTSVTHDEHHTHMLMQWGQFLDHDMTLAPQSLSFARFSDGRFCNETCENRYPCFPIPVPQNDPRIHRRRCLGLSRTSSTCKSGTTSLLFNTLTPRQQINAITAYIDASHVYGSTIEHSLNLRDLSNARGLLRVGAQATSGKSLLPFDVEGISDCQVDPNRANTPCFLAGDHRVNEHLSLSAMHTLWLREHNRIAKELLRLNPQWDHNRLYQETRKIVGALMQHITYTHWLPEILGETGMVMLGNHSGYDPKVDASVANSFATVAFRFGHSLIQPIIYRLNSALQPIPQGNVPLHKAFFSPDRLIEEGGIDPLLRGLFAISAKKRMANEVMNTDLTEKLFTLANEIGQDLAALNIQRGRDHGLPSYNDFRQKCGLRRITRFSQLRAEVGDQQIVTKLRALYGHVDNIDAFVGVILERRVRGSQLGPTLMCMMVEQFRATRGGDRHWYENEGVFTRNQVMQIKQVTLAGIICTSSDGIERVQNNVFVKADKTGGYQSCERVETLNLKLWTECCQQCSGRGGGRSRSFQSDQPASSVYQGTPRYSYPHQRPNVEVEKRLKTMESAMHKMSSEIREIQRQLHRQHSPRRDSGECVYKSQVKRDGEIWSTSECRSCQCLEGVVECETKPCPALSCAYPRRVQGRCCPQC